MTSNLNPGPGLRKIYTRISGAHAVDSPRFCAYMSHFTGQMRDSEQVIAPDSVPKTLNFRQSPCIGKGK